MEIQIEEKEYCKLSVNYKESFDMVSQKKGEIIKKFKSAQVPGFRPGHAPNDVIQNHFKKEIADALRNELAANAYHNTISEKNLKPFAQPVFNKVELEGMSFSCNFDIYQKPTAELKKYKGLEIPKQSHPISANEMLEKMIQDIRFRFGETTQFTEDDFVNKDDDLIIDYVGKVDGNTIDYLTAVGELLHVGATPIESFDDNLLGMKIGEIKSFIIQAPKNGRPEIVGKDVEFTVTLQNATRPTPAPLDDELAKKVGFDNLLMMRTEAQTMVSQRISEYERKLFSDQVMKHLVKENDFLVPDWLALAEAKVLASGSGKKEWEKLTPQEMDDFLASAHNNIKLSIILEKICEEEPDAQLTDEEAVAMLKDQLSKTSQDMQGSFKNLSETGYLPMFISKIRNEFTLDFVIKNCKTLE